MTVRGHLLNGVAVPDESVDLPEGAEVQIQVVTKPAPARVRRVGGQWRGQIQIADDFDDLPDNLPEAVGMRSTATQNAAW